MFGIREFRSGVAELIASANPVAVTRYRQTVGYFQPTDADMAAQKKAAAEFDRLLTARSVDGLAGATEFKAARKAGKEPVRKAAATLR